MVKIAFPETRERNARLTSIAGYSALERSSMVGVVMQ